MNFSFSQEMTEYADEVAKFAASNLNDAECLEIFSPEQWKAVSDFGILGITVSEDYGGLGESYSVAAAAFESLGYACKNNGMTFVINNHIWVSQNLIYLYGSDYLKDKYLRNMTSGERIGAIAITEAEAGSDAMSMRTCAVQDGDDYILNGTKMFISNGPIADIFIVFAQTKPEPFSRITAFVVERSFEGVSTGNDIEKMGLKSCPTSELILNNVRVSKNNILGKVNCGSVILTEAIEWERCFEFAPHVGAMRRIMEQCIEQAQGRKQFGKPINSYQGVSHKIADMRVAIEMSRLLLYKIAWLKDNKKSAYFEASAFKLYVSENYIKTCRDAMQIFGAYGYTTEYGIERELRDALACSIYSGTNEIQRNTIFSLTNTKFL